MQITHGNSENADTTNWQGVQDELSGVDTYRARTVQRQAADPKYSVYLSASAGTGKTKVLVDRVLRLLLEGSPPAHILCITYTNAAADEMHTRIQDKLLSWVDISDSALRAELNDLTGQHAADEVMNMARGLYASLIESIQDIRIQTIHAMCSQILSAWGHSNEQLSDFAIMDNVQRTEIRRLALRKLLDNANSLGGVDPYRAGDDINILLEMHDWGTLSSWLWQTIAHKDLLYKWSCKYHSKAELSQHIYERHDATTGVDHRQMLYSFVTEIHSQTDILVQWLQLLEMSDAGNFCKSLYDWLNYHNTRIAEMVAAIEKDGLQSAEYAQIEDIWNAYQRIWLTLEGAPRKKIYNKEFATCYPAEAAQILNEQSIALAREAQLAKQRVALYNSALFSISTVLQEIYEQYKQDAKLMEYDDLLCNTIELLGSSNANHILYQIDMRLDHVLVDEAQDLSALQWQLVKIITDEFFAGLGARDGLLRTVFIVGDFKQSIYGFQGASPEEFLRAKQYFRDKVQAASLDWIELQLEVSFRSTAAILESVDKLFNNLQHIGVEAVDSAIVRHIPYRSGGGTVENIELVGKNAAITPETKHPWLLPWQQQQAVCLRSQVAERIVTMIDEWLRSERQLLGRNRPIQPRDIMILVKRRGETVSALFKALRNRGIPVCHPDHADISNHIIVLDLLAVARFYLYPDDDLNLAGLLKSPLIALSDDGLYQLAINRGEHNLWQAVKESLPNVHSKLSKWREMAKEHDITTFYYKLIDEEQLVSKWAIAFGQAALEISNTFMELLSSWETPLHLGAWPDFLHWATHEGLHNTARSKTQPIADGVQIMTIHGAKGLQAPVVFLADAAASEHQVFERILWYDGEPYLNLASKEVDEKTALARTFKQQQDMQERNRLLYVAMTRAEDELYLCGWDNAKIERSWYARTQGTEP